MSSIVHGSLLIEMKLNYAQMKLNYAVAIKPCTNKLAPSGRCVHLALAMHDSSWHGNNTNGNQNQRQYIHVSLKYMHARNAGLQAYILLVCMQLHDNHIVLDLTRCRFSRP